MTRLSGVMAGLLNAVGRAQAVKSLAALMDGNNAVHVSDIVFHVPEDSRPLLGRHKSEALFEWCHGNFPSSGQVELALIVICLTNRLWFAIRPDPVASDHHGLLPGICCC